MNKFISPKIKEKRIDLMGTHISIKIYGNYSEKILEECVDLLYYYNNIFSMYDKNTELYKFNANKSLEYLSISDDLFYLIDQGIKHSLPEDSMLNICISPLVKLWNIGFSNASVPGQEEIDQVLDYTNPQLIVLDQENKRIKKLNKDLQIDLGALAKGYIADKLIDYLEKSGVKSAMVNLGGNIKVLGLALHNPDLYFHIGLQDPKEKRGNHLLKLLLNGKSIVTSGIYERKLETDEKIYHHILDPKTGYPIKSDMASISVISDTSLDGEIWTSRLFGKNFKDIEKTSKTENIDIIVIYKDNTIKYTQGVKKYLRRKEYHD
ncbi:FAD:protein FMN transferase [Helcococcus massiliensis]|uniref:FAD:protein FMN transferase n=1 Tax=Helcococcus massiliensis TaxID=2040290 RepID=UPI000CDE7931|nr:FAD:protein FMN transferase [Helcococcus massiliensis]